MTQSTPSRAELIERFSAGPAKLVAALQGLPESGLDLSLAPGEWSIRQHVHHLADDGDAWSMPLKKAIATPGVPVRFEGFPGNDAWADALDFHRRPIEPSVALIVAHGLANTQLVNAFAAAWDNAVIVGDPGTHESQKITVGDMVGFLGEHMEVHISTIAAIRRHHNV